MLTPRELADEVISKVSDGVAPTLRSVFGHVDNAIVEIGEAFEVWSLSSIIESPTIDLLARVRSTDRYQHQIFVDGRPAGFALSKPAAQAADWTVTRVSPSPLAVDIDQAIKDLFPDVPEGVPVRLLKATAYLVTALWLYEPPKHRFYIVACPASFTYLRRGAMLSVEEFTRGLAAEQATGELTEPKMRSRPASD